jgi:diacylglycerol kinase family enzyme
MKTSKNKLSDSITVSSNLQKLHDVILLINPNSQGGNTGKNWVDTYRNVKKFLPRHHKIIFTKKANDGISMTRKLLRKGYKDIVAVGGDCKWLF